jgi:hypothetical protein
MPVIEINDFKYGLNTNDASQEILPEQFSDGANVDISNRGKVTTIPGFAKLNSNEITGSTGIYGAIYAKSTHLASAVNGIYKKTTGDYSLLTSNFVEAGSQIFGYGSFVGRAVSFVATSTSFSQAKIKLYKTGNPGSYINLYLASNSSGLPNALLATSTNNINCSSITTGDVQTFNFTPYTLVVGTTYWLIIGISNNSGWDVSNNLGWPYQLGGTHAVLVSPGTWNSASTTLYLDGVTSNSYQSYFTEWNNYVNMTNGNNAPWKWDGTTVSIYTYPPSAWVVGNYPNYIENDGIRLWAFVNANDTLYWCSSYNQDYWIANNDRGNYDASVNTFPATGGSGTVGAIVKGDLWYISTAGTLGGTAVIYNQTITALVDTPGQTAGNWLILDVGVLRDAGYQALGYKDGYTGTGIVAQKDGLVVFKQKGIWKVFGTTPLSFTFSYLYKEIGCIAPRSVLNIDNKIYFLAKYKGVIGVWRLNETGGLEYLSGYIKPTLATMTSGSESLACAGQYNEKYVLSFPVASGWKTVRLNYNIGSWELDSGNDMACYYNKSDGTLYGGSATAGYVYTMDTGTTFDTAAINSYVTKDPIRFAEGDEYTKKIREIWLWVKASGDYKLNINFYVNGNLQVHTYYAQLGTKGASQGTRLEKVIIPNDVQGNTIGIKVGINAISQPWELYKMAILYDVKEPQSH